MQRGKEEHLEDQKIYRVENGFWHIPFRKGGMGPLCAKVSESRKKSKLCRSIASKRLEDACMVGPLLKVPRFESL